MNGPSEPIPPPPPPPPGAALPPVPPPRKGLTPLAWIGIGCGALVVLAMIGASLMLAAGGWFLKKQVDKLEKNPTLTVAEWYVRANPELELVSVDDEKGTITVRNIKTGEQMTVNAKDVEEGRLEVKTEDGTAVFDASGTDATIQVTGKEGEVATFRAGAGEAPRNLPSWLPLYPGGTVQGTFDQTTAEGRSAAFTVNTPDPADKVFSFYQSRLQDAGLKVEMTTTATTAEGSGGMLTASGENPRRDVSVLVSSAEGQTQAVITYQERK